MNTESAPKLTPVHIDTNIHHRAKVASAVSGVKMRDFVGDAVLHRLERVEKKFNINPSSATRDQ